MRSWWIGTMGAVSLTVAGLLARRAEVGAQPERVRLFARPERCTTSLDDTLRALRSYPDTRDRACPPVTIRCVDHHVAELVAGRQRFCTATRFGDSPEGLADCLREARQYLTQYSEAHCPTSHPHDASVARDVIDASARDGVVSTAHDASDAIASDVNAEDATRRAPQQAKDDTPEPFPVDAGTPVPPPARFALAAHGVVTVSLYNGEPLFAGGLQLALAYALTPRWSLFGGTRLLGAGAHPRDGYNDIDGAVAWTGIVGFERAFGRHLGVHGTLAVGGAWRNYAAVGTSVRTFHPGTIFGAAVGLSVAVGGFDARIEFNWTHNCWDTTSGSSWLQDCWTPPSASGGPSDVFGFAIALGRRYRP